jgi:hypothetical protein
MKLHAKLGILIAVVTVLGLGILVGTLKSRANERRREASYRAALALYAKGLRPLESREQVLQYVYHHGGQPESDSEPDSSSSQDVLVELGREPPPWFCSRLVTYLQLKFDDSEKFQDAALKFEAQDCM